MFINLTQQYHRFRQKIKGENKRGEDGQTIQKEDRQQIIVLIILQQILSSIDFVFLWVQDFIHKKSIIEIKTCQPGFYKFFKNFNFIRLKLDRRSDFYTNLIHTLYIQILRKFLL